MIFLVDFFLDALPHLEVTGTAPLFVLPHTYTAGRMGASSEPRVGRHIDCFGTVEAHLTIRRAACMT